MFLIIYSCSFVHNIACKPSVVMISDLTKKEKAQIIKFLVGLKPLPHYHLPGTSTLTAVTAVCLR